MNKLKESLNNNKITLGTWIQISHPSIIEIIVSNCDNKLDWICVDMEHGSIDIESMTNLIRTIERFNLVPVVRIPKNDYIWIHRTLDAGAKGLIIPMIKNEKETREAILESKYPPEGKRSFGYSRSNFYGKNFNEAIKKENNNIAVIIQIEHIDAVVCLKEILKIQGIDATFIGPLDLEGSLNSIDEKDRREMDFYLDIYMKDSISINVPTGFHIVQPNKQLITDIKTKGYKMIAIGIDTFFLGSKVNEIFES